MTKEGYTYGTWQTIEAVNTGIKVYRRKTETRSIRTRSFENPKAGDINYGLIAHGNDKSRNTAIHEVIARLCYCHRAELSMHMHGRIEW